MDITQTIALTLGTAWASGINLYAAVLTLGLLSATGYVELPPSLHAIDSPIVIGVAGLMFVLEFFADKIPGVDTAWDSIHTFIRIPAGAILAAGAVGDVNSGVMIAAALAGGTLAAGTHAAKSGSRILINTSPEPFTNIAASITEDVVTVAGIWTAVTHPVIFLCLLAVFVGLLFLLLPLIWRSIRRIFRWLTGRRQAEAVDLAPDELQLEHLP